MQIQRVKAICVPTLKAIDCTDTNTDQNEFKPIQIIIKRSNENSAFKDEVDKLEAKY